MEHEPGAGAVTSAGGAVLSTTSAGWDLRGMHCGTEAGSRSSAGPPPGNEDSPHTYTTRPTTRGPTDRRAATIRAPPLMLCEDDSCRSNAALCDICITLPYLTFGVGRLLHLPSAEAVSVRPNAQPRCNQKVTVIGCEAETSAVRPKSAVKPNKSPATWDW